MRARAVIHAARMALGGLRRRPGFSLGAVTTLALGLGAGAAVFSVVDAVLLRPLPFPEPERLSFLTREGDVSILDGVDWRAESHTFDTIALFLRRWNLDLVGDGEPERIFASVVEPDYFRVLRMAPLLGRTLDAEDNRVGAEPVAVLSEAFWRRRFGGDAGVVGRRLLLSGQPATVVGVMPAAFDFLEDAVDLWAPVATTTPSFLEERGTNNFDAIGRLRAGVAFEAARAEIVAITSRLAARYPRTNRGKIVEPLALHEFVVGAVRPALLALLGAVLLVALVASASVAALLLARHVSRRGEFAVRRAVGASSYQLALQVLAEGLLLGLAGGGAGLAVASWGRSALVALAPEGLPRASAAGLDGRVVGFTLALSLASALLFAALPALLAARTEAGPLLAGGEKGAVGAGPARRALGVLVSAEVALATVLLVGSLLLVRSFLRLQAQPLGFEPSGVLLVDVVLPETRYGSREPQTRAFREIVERLAQAPGVASAGYVTTPPLEPRGGLGGSLLVEGWDANAPPPGARVRFVYGDYFATLRLPIVRGRALTREDDRGAPAVVVNERLAERLWGEADPLGKRIAFRDFHGPQGPYFMTVVGVASDTKGGRLDAPDAPTLYAPYLQRQIEWNRWGTLAVRGAGDPAGLVGAVRAAVRAVDPELPLQDVITLPDKLERASAGRRFNALVVSLFGGVTLLLALQCLYGVLSFVVERSRREIGVRMSLGAVGGDVARLVAGRGLRLALAGLAVGLPTALLAARAAQGLLYGITAADAWSYVAVALGLAAAAVAAAAWPARRAARLEPAAILREP